MNISPTYPSASHVFTVTNLNDQPVTMAAAQVNGDPAFSVSQDGCVSRALRREERCQVTVTFDPTTIGNKAGALVVSGTEGRSSSVELRGTGFAILRVRAIRPNGQAAGRIGIVTGGAGLVRCRTRCEYEISTAELAKITLTARSTDSEWEFDGWRGACSGTMRTCVVNLTRDKTVTAMFTWIVE